MEKKNTQNKKAKKKTRGIFKPLKFFTDDRFKLVLGLFFIVFALFLTLAFISYFFTWKIDQSFEWSGIFSSSDIKVENWSGKTGAYFAFLFLNKWFGIVSFLFPLLLIIIGFRLLNLKLLPVWKTIKVTIFGVILISVCLGFLFGDTGGYLGSGLGGSHGFLLSEWLNAFIGKTGTGFLLLVSVIAFILFSFSKSLDWIGKPPPVKEDEITQDTFYTKKDKAVSVINLGEDDESDEDLMFETKEKEESENVKLTIEQKIGNDILTNGELKKKLLEDYDPTLDLSSFKFPPVSLLDDHSTENSIVSKEELISNKNRIVETLGNYKIQIDKIKATIGPTVTLYEIVPAPGIRISKIKNLEDDIALSLSALGIRIIAL
nr:DNA translocase FtsK [Bacteroidota bacterium]